MANVKAFIRTSKKSIHEANVRFRLTDGRSIQLFHKSDIKVETDLWDEKKEGYKAKCVIDARKRAVFNNSVADRKQLLVEVYNRADKTDLNSNKFEILIDEALHPEKYQTVIDKSDIFFSLFNEFLQKRKLSQKDCQYICAYSLLTAHL
jgi:hypothetical protein